jgi:hypothetical protein
MSSHLGAGGAALRRSARWSIGRLGAEDQVLKLKGRLRATFDERVRRQALDDHATRVVLATVLRADSNAIDVGANEGAVLESIVRLAPNGRHIAYEPIPELQRRRSDVDTSPDGVREISVATERLDDVLEEGYAPALIKIDVEGAELGVLRGAVETLHRHRPFVLFEHGVGGADLYDARPGELFDLLASCRLRIFDLEGTGPYTREQFEATFVEPIWNFLAAPG